MITTNRISRLGNYFLGFPTVKILCKFKRDMRTTNCCHTCLAFILKFLNLFQLFLGVSIISYSVYILNQWNKHLPDSSDFPWFIYAFMGLGAMLCCISCTGHIAAEAINGCCLCFYSLLKTVFILLEVAFVLFIALDHQWERDLPSDPTGEIDRFREFVESNIDFCKWIGIAVVVIQAICLLLAVVLRAMVSLQMKDDENDIEKDGDIRGKAWEPLLNPRATQTSVAVNGDGKAFRSDIWTSRMREKYGLSSK